MKLKYIISLIIIALLIAAVIIDSYKPKPLDWSPTFGDDDKIPYGKYLFTKAIRQQFYSGFIETDSSFYQLYNSNDIDITDSSSYVYISVANYWKGDPTSVNALLEWVSTGNIAFISSSGFIRHLKDTLGFSSAHFYRPVLNTSGKNEPGIIINLTNPLLNATPGYYYHKALNYSYIDQYDSTTTTVLGTFEDGKINFIAIKYGLGYFFINTANYMFTNYNIVKGNNYYYAAKAISYIPGSYTVIWDRASSENTKISDSPLRYILSQPPLKWAYFIALFSFLVYVLFRIKRLQRIIPVIAPNKNATIEFAKTISNLYLHRKNNKYIAELKVRHFYEFIRMKYNISNFTPNTGLIEKLSLRSGFGSDFLNTLFNRIGTVMAAPNISDLELIELNKQIDTFYRKSYHG